MKNKLARCATLAAIGLLAVTLIGCSHAANERADLESEVARLKTENDTLKQQNQDLQTRLAAASTTTSTPYYPPAPTTTPKQGKKKHGKKA